VGCRVPARRSAVGRGGTVVGYVNGAIYDEPGLVMEITNRIQLGNSGGPLLDTAGQVVGVVFAFKTSNAMDWSSRPLP